MDLRISYLDIPPEGILINHEVSSSELELPQEDGRVHGSLKCEGSLRRTGDSSACFQGRVSGGMVRECVRCLALFDDALDLPWEARFQKVAKSVPLSTPRSERKRVKVYDVSLDENETEEEAFPIIDNHIDLLSALREHVILATPLQPLCKENCEGLCQVCGSNLNEGVCGCDTLVTASSSSVKFDQAVFSQNQPKRSSQSVRRRS